MTPFFKMRSTQMRRLSILACVPLALLLATDGSGFAQSQNCTTDQERAAETEAETLRDWAALHQSFLRFKQCDDGSIAEGYSESVARIVVDHWQTLPKLASLTRTDRPFLSFVLKHIDATLNPDDLKRIQENASSRCPAGLASLCSAIGKHAISALGENSPTK